MRDLDIRTALLTTLRAQHSQDTLILDELGVAEGAVRVDVAVINGTLNGYEIKSDSDTLERLPHQQEAYSKVFDTVTIVTHGPHLPKVLTLVPEWWGVLTVTGDAPRLQLSVLRPAVDNPRVDPFAVAQLLWREEALSVLAALGVDRGLRGKPRRFLWQALAENLPLPVLRAEVRRRLKARRDWRVDAPQRLGGAMFPLCATP